jgi:hypothetical protein
VSFHALAEILVIQENRLSSRTFFSTKCMPPCFPVDIDVELAEVAAAHKLTSGRQQSAPAPVKPLDLLAYLVLAHQGIAPETWKKSRSGP